MYMERHTMTVKVSHSRSTALERLVNVLLVGLQSILRGHNLLPWYTQDICSVRVTVEYLPVHHHSADYFSFPLGSFGLLLYI